MALERRFSEPSDGFFFDVEKWAGSRSAQRMSFSQRGVYLEMLFYQWKKRNLPDDAQKVAELIAITADQQAEVVAAWDVVRRKFVSSPSDATRIYNVALELTRRKQAANLRKKQVAGREAGLASARKRQQTRDLDVNDRSTTVQRPLTTVQRPSTEENRREEKGLEGKRQEGTARSKRPIFSGQRFAVFEWQLDDLTRMLGPHIEAFDLHDWFFALDAAAIKANTVIPQRDGGAWLQGQLLEECRRRGFPIAQASTVPTNKRIAGLVAGGERFLRGEV